MNKHLNSIIICSVLSLAFLAGGLLSLMNYDEKRTENQTAVRQLQQEQAQLEKESCKEQVTSLQSSNEQLQKDIETLESECADLEKRNTGLKEEYEQLSQDENNIYYMTVLESLQKGIEKVEQYIKDAQ